MAARTDMALELEKRISGSAEGIVKSERQYDDAGLKVTEIEVTNEAGAAALGRPVGRYITAACSSGRLSDSIELAAARAEVIASELRGLMPLPERVLIGGLGNTQITPDSLGPAVASGVFATRHLKHLAADLDTSELSEVTVISAGVMAQTGLESRSLIGAICREVEPQLVIAIDALACSELSHLGSTVQLSTGGISPGSGVENARVELSERTLGVPCIAIGIPTVTDCSVIAEAAGGSELPEHLGMIVTPKDIDSLIARSAAIISLALNRALHPTLSREDIELIMG
ncbi:MAG: GPR endopeptidase [Ruminococcus sp.]|nr:GPR endopeptidase [Ruminococcus sp.]